VAGVAVLGANWKNLAFLNPATATPAAPPTAIASLVPPTDVPPPVATVEVSNPGSVLLEDDFSARSSNWGTLSGAESSIEYLADALQVRVFKENFVVWTTPNDQEYDNIHLEVTVRTNDSDPTTAFGLMCAQQVEEWSFYYLVITPAGEYTIAKATTGETDVFLTNNDQWATSDLIADKAASYRIGADCGNGSLTLYVDGQQIASVSDSTYTTGYVGVYAWSGDKANSADITFDDFLITSLE